MNIFEVLKKGKDILKNNNIEDFDFDAVCLLEEAFSFSKNDYFINRFNEADEEKTVRFFEYIKRRASCEPLQYIIGKWPFMNGEFYVGSGVLIPRSDTEILVETAINYIKDNDVKVVYDLCAGSGCVGISVASSFPDIQVYCVELSDVAYSFLEKNIAHNNVKNVKAIKGDITEIYKEIDIKSIDVLLSNPPYIETAEIELLSQEVKNEPFMALDGGADGFAFYDVICKKWISQMKSGSFSAFECGETQANGLKKRFEIFSDNIKIYNDLNGIQRVVSLLKN